MYHDFNYETALASSLKGAWQLDDVLREDQELDFTRRFMPESLSRTAALTSLSADEQRILNHICAHQYLGIFGVVEEFILPFLFDHARPALRGDDWRVQRCSTSRRGSRARPIVQALAWSRTRPTSSSTSSRSRSRCTPTRPRRSTCGRQGRARCGRATSRPMPTSRSSSRTRTSRRWPRAASSHMELRIKRGRGYVSADKNFDEDLGIGWIPVDSVHSPVKKVNYLVEAARIGQTTDYDKLTVDVWTNGSVTPRDAVSLSAKLIRDHLNIFINLEDAASCGRRRRRARRARRSTRTSTRASRSSSCRSAPTTA